MRRNLPYLGKTSLMASDSYGSLSWQLADENSANPLLHRCHHKPSCSSSSVPHEEKHKKEIADYEWVVAIWQCKASAPPPACRLGPVEAGISQMKLMRTSGGGSTNSSSRLSSL
ncbi:hypothetical protein NQZ68_031313 [Dissostichus eleginoides]|nr:hypothetical protein NQZ68_031313 [Dissostichus eleginoides]